MTTYDDLRIKVGRRPITVVELDLDFCNNLYGSSPCTASVGVTGTQECFNCFATCQDTANFDRGTKTYKFTEANSFLPIGETIYPCITSVDIAPTQLKPGAFSVSASVTVALQDFPHHDRGVDPYWYLRFYNPIEQGTFFGKLRARNPNVANRVMRVKTGYVDADRTVYTLTRTYFIDRIEGPDASGRVKIVGKDLLRFEEIAKTKVPKLPTAFLDITIGTAPTTVNVTPSGAGANYETSGRLAIDEELVDYTRSGDTFTITARNREATTAAVHAAGTPVIDVFPNTSGAKKIVLNIKNLLLAAGIDSSYIPYSAWETECDTYISPFASETAVAAPESVKTLIEEMLEEFGCSLWWDELDAQLKFKVLSTGASATASLNDTEHILKGSMVVKTLEKERITRVQINYGILKKGALPNSVSTLTRDTENTSISRLYIDTAAENPNLYGGSIQKTIVSRWLSYNAHLVSGNQVQKIADRYLARYVPSIREVSFSLDAKDSTIRTGNVIEITSRMLQAFDGTQSPVKFIVTEFREVVPGSHYKYTALELPA